MTTMSGQHPSDALPDDVAAQLMEGIPQVDYTPRGQISQAYKFAAGLRRRQYGWRRVMKWIGIGCLLAMLLTLVWAIVYASIVSSRPSPDIRSLGPPDQFVLLRTE